MKNFHPKILPVIVLILTGSIQSGCNQNRSSDNNIYEASPDGHYASAAYLTRDHKGIPVLSWNAHRENDDEIMQYVARFDEANGRFGRPIPIRATKGTVAHAESMNKIAWKANGTLVSVFEVKHPDSPNQWAGSVMYSQSFDDGKTWTEPKPVHSDTSTLHSRSFFDVATLPDGEVGVVWLDGRHGNDDIPGTSLYFAQTRDDHGFVEDRELLRGVCECCRTVVYTSEDGAVYVLFRNIFEDSVRDLAMLRSDDSGQIFTGEPVHVHNDNWVIHGCPHTGPSMGSGGNARSVAWYTAGDQKGVLFTTLDKAGKGQPAELISATAASPQLDVTADGETGLVWVERNHPSAMLHFQLRDGFEVIRHLEFGYEQAPNAAFPVVLSHGSSWIIAWTEEKDLRSVVKYKIVEVS